MDIEKVAKDNPEKIITNKIDLKNEGPNDKEIESIVSIYKLNTRQQKDATKLILSLYKILKEKDASLIEINPLIITKDQKIVCLEQK